MRSSLISNFIKPAAKLLVGLVLFYCLAVFALSFVATKNPTALAPADVIIVHGAGGENNVLMMPSIRRAEKAAEAYHAGLAAKIVFTGAADKHGNLSVAEMMAAIAIENGVPDAIVLIEDKSFSTYANLIGAREILDGFPQRTILISHGFHLPRCFVLAKILGAQDVALLSTDRFYQPLIPNGAYIYARELIAIPANLIRLLF